MIATAAPITIAAPTSPAGTAAPTAVAPSLSATPNVDRLMGRVTALEARILALRAQLAEASFQGNDLLCERLEKRMAQARTECDRLALAIEVAARRDEEEAAWQRARMPGLLTSLYEAAAEDMSWRTKVRDAQEALARVQRAYAGRMLDSRIQGIENELRAHGITWEPRHVPIVFAGNSDDPGFGAQAKQFGELAAAIRAEHNLPPAEEAQSLPSWSELNRQAVAAHDAGRHRQAPAAANGTPRQDQPAAVPAPTPPSWQPPGNETMPAMTRAQLTDLRQKVEQAGELAERARADAHRPERNPSGRRRHRDPAEVGYEDGPGDQLA